MFSTYVLAQAQTLMPDARSAWLPVVMLLVIAVGFAVTNIIASLIIGPSRQGAGKSETYESGMVPFGDAQKRFNVRFYIVAMIFLVIDVEIVFFYPWATIFGPYSASTDPAFAGFSTVLLIEILIFTALLLLAYIYAWGKGVFRWE
ncbi:MAG TPA: NADH-quinone oxidoreductase subunit A [Tepidisphaeraceae bacterium]|nr:NADH-quinone oxidoreductase subunit A [Tepidisphaeraceae bacterium]